MNSYGMLGSFSIKKNNVDFDIALAMPALNSDRQPGKFRLKVVEEFETGVTQNVPGNKELPVLLIIVEGKRDVPAGAAKVPNNGLKNSMDFTEIKLSRQKSSILTEKTSQVLTIVFHSDQKPDEIIECFKNYLKKGLYEYYLVGSDKGESFDSYYKSNCMEGLELTQPETAGGGILVGG